ncbi:MAG TPA: TetR/AcrR family transcriptional regulator [Acidimicrobiales bacterium]|nr:TetR/AcrR family transcriptional regulator [Acidimicrobiales bacterium]
MASVRAERAEKSEPCAPRRGRPLATDREEAILKATVQLLGERGFDRFTVQDIADRAGVGLGTIYRRWPTKLDAVVAAIRLLEGDDPVTEPTGDVEADLVRALTAAVRSLSGCLGAVVPGLVSAMRDDADLAHLLRETTVSPRFDMFRQIIAPAFADPVERNLRAEMAMAIPLYRVLFSGKLPTQNEIRTELVPLILGRPIAEAKRAAKRAPRGAKTIRAR